MRRWLLFLFILPCLRLAAQTDSGAQPLPVKQTVPVSVQSAQRDTAAHPLPVKKKAPVVATPAVPKDSLSRPPVTTALPKSVAGPAQADTMAATPVVSVPKETDYDVFLKELGKKNAYLKENKPSRLDMNPLRHYRDLDWLVYTMGGIVLLLGIIRLSYLKYFSDLFRAFLNPTLSQRQLKDQLSQSPFPNFLLNAFFVISLALYIYLLMFRQQYITNTSNAWMVIPGLILLVAIVYSVKYVMLRFCGWLFGSIELADSYIFILYLINKVLGILLVPFLVILAFCQPNVARAFLYISVFFIVVLVGYRYVRSYSVVKQYLSFSRLHFFLYLCAFEVAPVLIITKVLLIWLTGSPGSH
ncbi:protein of unknown function [Chitinophaga sp. CF118]|uniref:DUF4271 domain-containing protein n=1 Tax=Chitinophaga sp. CF118 TaxID=1884367 RepID=UPI0008E4C213|nr:DUF4271 domain-containing protein [Chitinophaga sp. CF118]SFD30075.1 protein of unknown function [Chitinophaga sp. CF118]